MTEQEKRLLIKERYELKQYLAKTDYMAIKFLEGELDEKKFAPIRQERKEARLRIREIETELEKASK